MYELWQNSAVFLTLATAGIETTGKSS